MFRHGATCSSKVSTLLRAAFGESFVGIIDEHDGGEADRCRKNRPWRSRSGCTVYTGDVGEPESAIEERCGGETSGREGIEKLGLWKRLDSHWVKWGFLLFSLCRAQIRTSLRHRQ